MTIYSPTPASDGESVIDNAIGTKDGQGCADNDQPYRFGRRPTSAATFPFTSRQFARLLSLRGRVADGLTGTDDREWTATRASLEKPIKRTSLFYECLACGAMVPGGHQSEPRVLCPMCSVAGDRDGVARLILASAGVL
jgi:hypothetical protein